MKFTLQYTYIFSFNLLIFCSLKTHWHKCKTFPTENKTVYLWVFLRTNAHKNGKLMAVFIFFSPILVNYNLCSHSYTHFYKWCLFTPEKYSNTGAVSSNIHISPPFSKIGELIFEKDFDHHLYSCGQPKQHLRAFIYLVI